MQEQKKKLEKAEANYVKVNSRIRELQSSYQEGSAGKLLETLTEDVNNMRIQVRMWRGMGGAALACMAGWSDWGGG